MDVGRLYANKYYDILCKRLECPQMLVSEGVPGIDPPRILRDDCIVYYI